MISGTVTGILLLAYFLGSIPFGLIITRLAGIGDIRSIGSGNIGATNVMRTGKKSLGVLTLLLDAIKGAMAVLIAKDFGNADLSLLAGFIAVIGHVFPIWLRFKGGKGVATAIGVLFGVNVLLGAATCAIWLLVFLYIRISSIAALLSITLSAVPAYLLGQEYTSLLCLTLTVLIIYTHRTNIQRLIDGTEHVFKEKTS